MAVAIMENNGLRKEVKLGFSWTTFLFGWFVPLFRGDGKNAVIFLISGIIAGVLSTFTFGIAGIIYAVVLGLKYNQIYIKGLIEKGWKPATESDRQLLISNGVVMNGEQ